MKKRIFAALLCVIMLFGMLPITALAAGPKTIYVDATSGDDENDGSKDLPYATVVKAVTEAESGDTIQLGEGNYTLYDVDSEATTKGKDLTFVGLGTDKTTWNIGTPTKPPLPGHEEQNSDYSFKGSKTIVFKDMTLRAAVKEGTDNERVTRDYTGFSYTTDTVVDNCIIDGKTFYWGYNSATFTNTTFNCPFYDYALWTYCSPTMTFENCTFNSLGKVINVYTDYSAGKHNITVNFENCTVNNNSFFSKQVLNVNDSNMGNFKYIINISGDNKVSGISVDSITCSRLFGFGGDTGKNTGRLEVSIEDTQVWGGGERVGGHAQNFSTGSYDNGKAPGKLNQYTEGYKDNAFTPNFSWTSTAAGTYTGTGRLDCNYCPYYKEDTFTGYAVTYDLNGGSAAENADYDETIVVSGHNTFIQPAPDKQNDRFAGWKADDGTLYQPGEAVVVTAPLHLTAQWTSDSDNDAFASALPVAAITLLGLDTDDHIAYVYGYPDGTVRPNGTITRAEVTTIFYRLLTSARRDEIFTSENSFRDVDSSMWYNKAASSMAAGGYIQGYADGTFGANKPITRAEFVCLAARFATKTTGFASYTDVDNGHWAARSIAICASNGWVQGYEDGTFRPDQPITRAEAMTIINRMLGRGVSKGYVCKGAARFTDNDPGSWYYYEILEATNDHEYRNARPFEQWIRATILRSYDMDKYERP
ncbi:MAG: S-layer homology domain-containing protein [Clostridiales bacterium]|nr:S-layer homology domain-containing protein [Clostridiales bacterium]